MSDSNTSVLVIVAHPRPRKSAVVMQMARLAQSVDGVTVHDIYAEYPDFLIDIPAEQALLRDHQVIIFCHPFNWYSAPALLREWQDVVLEYGFAYGRQGQALRGKLFLSAITAGRSVAEYSGETENHYSLLELMRPVEQMCRLCGLVYLPPFALIGARNAEQENRLEPHLETWRRLLIALRDGEIDVEAVQDLPYLDANALDAANG